MSKGEKGWEFKKKRLMIMIMLTGVGIIWDTLEKKSEDLNHLRPTVCCYVSVWRVLEKRNEISLLINS